MTNVNAAEIEKEHELQQDINEANCRISELINAQKLKDDECRSLREEKDKYWSQLVYCMREKSDYAAVITNLNHDIATREAESSRIIASLEGENDRLQSLYEEEKKKTASLAQTAADSYQRNRSLQQELTSKTAELEFANREIETLLQKMQLRDNHVEQLTKAYEKLLREQNGHGVNREKKRPSIGSNLAAESLYRIVSHSRSDSTDSLQSTASASTVSVLVAAKEADPDKEALSLGMLLSQQMKEFGTTMFDSLRAGDEEVLEEYRLGGFTREEGALLLFEERYGKVSTQNTVVHPALPHTRLPTNTNNSNNCINSESAPFRSPTKIEQLMASNGHHRSLSHSLLPPSGSNSSTYAPSTKGLGSQPFVPISIPRPASISRPSYEEERFPLPTSATAQRGHRNWNSASDINLVLNSRR